jgi:hypothetical protein
MTEFDEFAKTMTEISKSHQGLDIIDDSQSKDESHLHFEYILTPLQRKERIRENSEQHMDFVKKLKRR